MASSDWMRELYQYNEWANTRLLDVASGLTDARLREDRPGSESIAVTLLHVAQAQHGWWCFWTDTGSLPGTASRRSCGRPHRLVSQLT
jgi:uncharacterized damage-inducible protein DinB